MYDFIKRDFYRMLDSTSQTYNGTLSYAESVFDLINKQKILLHDEIPVFICREGSNGFESGLFHPNDNSTMSRSRNQLQVFYQRRNSMNIYTLISDFQDVYSIC